MKTILYYVDLHDMTLFNSQLFYANTQKTLEDAGFKVIVTNRITDAVSKDFNAFFGFFFKKAVIPALFAKIRRKRVFLTGGLDDLDRNSVSFLRYIKQLFLFKIGRWCADACLIESHSDLEKANQVCFYKNHKNLFYSPQGIEISHYNCSFDNKEKYFCTICWMGLVANVKRKGCDIALYYFKKLKSHPLFADYKFVIIGRGGEGQLYLEEMVRSLKLGDDVIFLGQVNEEEKVRWLKKSKYFFQLSKMEGFGLAALESLAAKCIPIHTINGGLRDTMAYDGLVIDIDGFSYTTDEIDDKIADKLLGISSEDVLRVYGRIQKTFDSTRRVERFKSIIYPLLM